MSMHKLLLGAAALILLAGSALAGGISPGLNQILAGTDDDTPVKVMVFLREQVDIEGLNQELRQAKATRATRHNRVITELQDLARNTQGALLATLESERGRGRVLGYTPHWLINSVVVVATKDMIHELAARDDVDAIEPDLVVELIAPVSEEDLPEDKADRGIGITPGVVSVGARRVWEELGIRGEGTLIGTLDTGVQGSHPALASRWRGLSAPWQHAWLDLLAGNTQFPVDNQSHGTHVTGTIAGLAPDDTIGVAPAAEWLACNAINQGVGSEFDNDVLAALAWFADPDGDPNTVWDVPDVVQNSWGVNQNFSGYFQCDSRWWTMIDACEAAGVVLTWSAGNEGPGSTSLRSPADRATTLYNCFSVGSTIATPPFTISSFSSRGPAGPNCGPEENRMKPEIVAPGSDIYSAVPGGGYGYKSGTSMSGPHIAGVVALMRSANPDLDVDTIKQILMDTAIDLGPEGEDNTYGHGFVDAYMAVLMVMDGIGYLEGTVLADDTGLPIPGAFIDVVDSPRAVTADENGEFRMTLQQDTYDLEISAFGFETGTATVTIVEDETLVETFSLIRLPSATISGTVYDPDGAPAVGATVTALGTPVPSEVTDGNGFYSLLLPVGDTYTLRAITVGVGLAYAEVHLTGDVTVDLYMDPLVQESFETGDFAAFPWDFGGNAPWIVDTSQSYHGDYSARGGMITHNQSTTLRISFDVAIESELSFFYKVSSEANYDYLEFWVNGTRLDRWAGEVPWTEYVYNAVPGSYVMEWTYRKDGSVNNGADTGWIDLVTFPLMAAPPRIEIDPPALSVTVDPDGTAEETLTVFNLGEAPLSFRFMAREIGIRQAAPQHPEIFGTKGGEITGDGNSPVSSQGGPDAFGYRWIDSNEPGGPEFNWVNITGNGTALPSFDDATLGPYPLGFTFNYYGVNYTQVRICTNGFLTFENTTAAPHTNQRIPNTAVPNALIAPFWDDHNPNQGGTIYYLTDEANQRFIVHYHEVARFGNPSQRQTFQVILTPNGNILFQYHTLSNTDGCTVGIENTDGTDGLEVLYNTGGYLQNGMAILFTTAPAIPWISYDPEFGSVPGGGFAEVTIGFDATDVETGEYSCELVVINNDPTQDDLIIPVVMVVSDGASVGALPAAFTRFEASPNPFHPSSARLRFSLAASGQAELKLIDVQGRLVRTLFSGHLEAGLSEISWDGRDNAGRPVASGTYYARLTVAGQSRVKPLVVVR